MLKIIGRKTSSNVMKVLWACVELGLDYEREDLGGPFGGNDSPEYQALNPNGKVPTIIEDDFVLWESNSIMVFWGLVRTPEAERDMDAILRARDGLAGAMGILDRYLGETAFVGGPDFGVGDIPVGVGTYRWFALPIEREDYPNLKRWYDALTQRAGYQEHIMNPME
jgi:glutathione S-transferase